MGDLPAQPRRGRPVRLTADQRPDVFAEFGPDDDMRIYGRGIRRRLAPMLGGDRRRIEMAYSLQFSLRGTPVIRYGEEIGMGDDLSLPVRDAIRTPMQWSPLATPASPPPRRPAGRPVVTDGAFGYDNVNVRAQRNDPDSLLSWFERMMRTLRECPEINAGTCTHVDVPTPPGLLVHRAEDASGTMLFLHNLGDQDPRGCQQRRRDDLVDHRDVRRPQLRRHRPGQLPGRRLRLPLDLPSPGNGFVASRHRRSQE